MAVRSIDDSTRGKDGQFNDEDAWRRQLNMEWDQDINRKQLMSAITDEDIETVEMYLSKMDLGDERYALFLRKSSKTGKMELIGYLYNEFLEKSMKTGSVVITMLMINMLIKLSEKYDEVEIHGSLDYSLNRDLGRVASLNMIKYILPRLPSDFIIPDAILNGAITNQRYDLIQWVLDHYEELCELSTNTTILDRQKVIDRAFIRAGVQPTIELLKLLWKYNPSDSSVNDVIEVINNSIDVAYGNVLSVYEDHSMGFSITYESTSKDGPIDRNLSRFINVDSQFDRRGFGHAGKLVWELKYGPIEL